MMSSLRPFQTTITLKPIERITLKQTDQTYKMKTMPLNFNRNLITSKSSTSLITGLKIGVMAILVAISLSPANLAVPLATAATTTTCPSLEQRPFKLEKVAKGTYVRKGKHQLFRSDNFAAIANISIIIGEQSIAVIDTGGSHCDGTRFLKAIRKISNKPISHIIITHSHPDHSLGTAAFMAEKATIIGHANLAHAMHEKGPLYLNNLRRIVGVKQMANTTVVPPQKTVKNSMVIDLGKRPLTLTSYQTAHTDQDLTVFDQTTKILWCGDLLFHERIPVVDGSLLGWQKTIEQLALIKAKSVVPGHGGPLLTWPQALAPQQAYLAALTKDLRAIIEQGGTMLQAQKTAGQSQKNLWLLFDEYNARNATTGFAELEWE